MEDSKRRTVETMEQRLIRLHVDTGKFKVKPTGAEIGTIKKHFTRSSSIKDLTVEQIADKIVSGVTVQPGVCPFSEESQRANKKGTVKDDFTSQTVFMVDIDNKEGELETPEHIAKTLAEHDLKAAFMYETFNSTAKRIRFRFAVVCSEEITDPDERDRIQHGLIGLSPQSDEKCSSAAHIFFGTDKGLIGEFTDFGAVCKREDLLALEDEDDTITEGYRENGMFHQATSLLTRYGDTDEAREKYDEYVGRLEVIPGEVDPPQPKADYVYERCQKFYHEKTERRRNYIPPDKFNSKGRKGGLTFKEISTAYMEEHLYIVGVQKLGKGGGYGNDRLYEYENGVWLPKSDGDVRNELSNMVAMSGEVPDPYHIDKALKVIMSLGERRDVNYFDREEDLVCFQNGVYRLSDGAKLEHSPDYLFSIQLNANIPDEILPTPYCDRCINNFGDGDVYNLLLQIFGATISNVPIPKFKKGVLQYGKGDSGKTQLKRLAERVLGAGNYNNTDLSELEGSRFAVASFERVRLGGANDMSNVRVKEEKMFKRLTGGDSIQAENKNERGFQMVFNGMLWFLANDPPLFGGDKGDHVYDRWIVIPCKHRIPKEQQIKGLQDRMFEERDSFCIKALRAFQKAVEANYEFDIPESCRLANMDYRYKNSDLRMFIEECCEPLDIDTCTRRQTTGKFWQDFKTWCYEGNYHVPKKSDFRRELAQIAGVDEDELDCHTKEGNFYPYVVVERAWDPMID